MCKTIFWCTEISVFLPNWIFFFPFLETHPDADPDQIANDYGFINIGQIGSLDHHYLFEHPKVHKRSIQKSHDLHFNLTNHPHIKWCEQQKELKRQEPMNYRTIMQTLFTLLTHCTLISLTRNQFEIWRLKGIKTNKSELWNRLT